MTSMKDCLGNELVRGDLVVIVVPVAPLPKRSLRRGARVVRFRHGLIGIRLTKGVFQGVKYVLPDAVMDQRAHVRWCQMHRTER